MPLFTGGRIGGNETVARGNVDEAAARLRQAREAAALDAQVAINSLAQAEATMASTASTAEQAQRAYSIAGLRFQEGISTQLDLADARLLLEQALANQAVAARNYQVARARLALLRDLPLGTGSAATTQGTTQQGGQSGGSAGQQSQTSQPQAPQTGGSVGATTGTTAP
jgi:outer membrane protein TolC